MVSHETALKYRILYKLTVSFLPSTAEVTVLSFVRQITQNVVDGFGFHFKVRLFMEQLRNDIFRGPVPFHSTERRS